MVLTELCSCCSLLSDASDKSIKTLLSSSTAFIHEKLYLSCLKTLVEQVNDPEGAVGMEWVEAAISISLDFSLSKLILFGKKLNFSPGCFACDGNW